MRRTRIQIWRSRIQRRFGESNARKDAGSTAERQFGSTVPFIDRDLLARKPGAKPTVAVRFGPHTRARFFPSIVPPMPIVNRRFIRSGRSARRGSRFSSRSARFSARSNVQRAYVARGRGQNKVAASPCVRLSRDDRGCCDQIGPTIFPPVSHWSRAAKVTSLLNPTLSIRDLE